MLDSNNLLFYDNFMDTSALPALPPRGTLRGLCLAVRGLVLLGALLLASFVAWLVGDPTQALAPLLAGLGLGGLAVDGALRWRALAVMLPLLALGAVALWQLWRLFGLLLDGRALTVATQRRLQRFAAATCALALLSPLAGTALVLVMTLDRPPGQRQLVIAISSDQYLAALLAIVLLVLARVMADAVRAAEENAGFV